MKNMKSILLIILLISAGLKVNGNAVVIANLSSVPGSDYVQLEFDLTWDNSWKNGTNYDAVWVFFKWKDNDGTWRHLNLTGLNNTITAGYTLTVPADKTGCMIYRSANGTGVALGCGYGVFIACVSGHGANIGRCS